MRDTRKAFGCAIVCLCVPLKQALNLASKILFHYVPGAGQIFQTGRSDLVSTEGANTSSTCKYASPQVMILVHTPEQNLLIFRKK